jgi:hypothetical protein
MFESTLRIERLILHQYCSLSPPKIVLQHNVPEADLGLFAPGTMI